MHPACMHVNTCTYIPQHTSTSIQLNRYTQKYINLWLWPKRPPLTFSMAEMSEAEMSWPKCPWPKRPWPKYPTFHYLEHMLILKMNKNSTNRLRPIYRALLGHTLFYCQGALFPWPDKTCNQFPDSIFHNFSTQSF